MDRASEGSDGNLIFVVKGVGRLCEFSMRQKETCWHTESAVWCEREKDGGRGRMVVVLVGVARRQGEYEVVQRVDSKRMK